MVVVRENIVVVNKEAVRTCMVVVVVVAEVDSIVVVDTFPEEFAVMQHRLLAGIADAYAPRTGGEHVHVHY